VSSQVKQANTNQFLGQEPDGKGQLGSQMGLVKQLILIALIMFGFGYALVPFVEVTFTSHSHTSLPWEFKPLTNALDVKVGAIQDAVFYVKNYSNKPITGMATFNVTPARAGFHFKKTECFCFSEQVLQPGEEKEMAVRFLLDSDMPDDVHELTLSYTFFDTTFT